MILKESLYDDIVEFYSSNERRPSSDPIDDYADYKSWATQNGLKVTSPRGFKNQVKLALKSGEFENVSDKNSSDFGEGPEDILGEIPKSVETDFERDIRKNEVLYKFQMMEFIVSEIGKRRQGNAFVYGVGGIGKSHTLLNVFKRDRTPGVVIKKGGIGGATALYTLLYENKDDKIIVLDDNDSLLANGNIMAINLLKGAMENPMDGPRTITYFQRKAIKKDG